MELIYCQKELTGFINLSTNQRLRHGDIELIVKTEEDETSYPLQANKGRQRLKLTPEVLDNLTKALQEKKNVTLLIGEYEQTIEHKRFNKHFKDLKKKYLKIIEL